MPTATKGVAATTAEMAPAAAEVAATTATAAVAHRQRWGRRQQHATRRSSGNQTGLRHSSHGKISLGSFPTPRWRGTRSQRSIEDLYRIT
jgi:hypothetical protein